MRTPLIAGNWKMHKTVAEATDLVQALFPRLRDVSGVEVVVAPPHTALYAVGRLLRGTPLGLAAQNMHWEDAGAYTGEVSAPLLREVGATHVILGHSERRQYFGETDRGVARKTAKALATQLTPIVCVGETLEQREAGHAFEVVGAQLRGALGELAPALLRRVLVAYEPVWAIGTGRTASSAQAQEVHAHLRGLLTELGGKQAAAEVRILYGGSVKPDNAGELLGQPDIDGALVGGASLEPETFASIVRFRV